jgi:hypothetical protein
MIRVKKIHPDRRGTVSADACLAELYINTLHQSNTNFKFGQSIMSTYTKLTTSKKSSLSMRRNYKLATLSFSILVIFLVIISMTFSPTFKPWYHTRIEKKRLLERKHLRHLRRQVHEEAKLNNKPIAYLSHQPANPAPARDYYPWTKSDGTPLPYDAWFTNPPIPKMRSRLIRGGARVACWPSTGGIWLKQADLVDMDFLGLNRFADTPKQHTYNAHAEDQFCTLMKMLGADFYKLPLRAEKRRPGIACETLESCFEPDYKNNFLLAWPETSDGVCFLDLESAKERGGEMMGGWYNAKSMDERCRVLEIGATCECKKECSHLQDLDWGFRGIECPREVVWEESLGNYWEEPKERKEKEFHPEPSREVHEWADAYCYRNGWRRVVKWKEGGKYTCELDGYLKDLL